jgi:hypothetical protein
MADVVVWAVAVEKYDGSDLTLKQPVGLWALEFAETLLEKGAPRVILTTSLRFENEYAQRIEKLEQTGLVQRTGADQADIQNALQLVRGGDALMIYWVGHGIMAPHRQMLCADSAGATATRSITVESLLKRLRSAEYAPLQIGFLECCAQVVTTTPASLDLGGDGATARDQYFYYAASAAQIASASTARPGFSSTILQNLAGLQTIPPQPAEFFSVLRAAFDKLSGQLRPFQMERTDGSGDVWSSGYSSAFKQIDEAAELAQLTRSEFQRVWRHALKSGRSAVEFAAAFSNGAVAAFVQDFRIAQPNSAEPEFLERALQQLKIERTYAPLCLNLKLLWREWLAFYNRIAREQMLNTSQVAEDLPGLLLNVLNQVTAEKRLRDFANLIELAARRSQDLAAGQIRQTIRHDPDLGQAYAALTNAMAQQDDRLYLLLDVEWEPNTRAAALKKAWIHPGLDGLYDEREIAAGSLVEQINATVQDVLEEYPERSLTIELLSPNELFSVPMDFLRFVDPDLEIAMWLEAAYPITVRWKTRLQDKKYRGTWKQRALQVIPRAQAANSLVCLWRPPTVTDIGYHVQALAFPGPSPTQPARNKAMFFGELVKGEPLMCWPRNDVADADAFRVASDQFFSRQSLQQLPEALREGRNDPLLRELVVLIDLPDRNPYINEQPLTGTGQRGTT